MFDIFNHKKVKKLEAYIDVLEIKLRKQEEARDLLKEEYNELLKKYNKLKLEHQLQKGN